MNNNLDLTHVAAFVAIWVGGYWFIVHNDIQFASGMTGYAAYLYVCMTLLAVAAIIPIAAVVFLGALVRIFRKAAGI